MARRRQGHKLTLLRPNSRLISDVKSPREIRPEFLMAALGHTGPDIRPASVVYALPRAVLEGDRLVIGQGYLDAEPKGAGVGSHFMETHFFPLMRQMAARTDRQVVHQPWPDNERSRRFYGHHHGYTPLPDGRFQRVFEPEGRPKPLSANAERTLRELFHEHYVIAEEAKKG